MSKQKSKTTAEARKEKVEKVLNELGHKVYNDLDNSRFPSVTFASRSVSNIVYDKKLQQFILGSSLGQEVRREHQAHQAVHAAALARLLLEEAGRREEDLDAQRRLLLGAGLRRGVQDQAESDELITDLEVLLGSAREEFNVFPEERSAIFGNLTVEYTVPGYEGKKLDLSSHPDGMMIGPALTTAEFADTDAEMVLAIEKGGLFTRFIEEKVHEKYKAILINTRGAAPALDPVPPEEAAPGAQAAHRDTLRRRPLGGAHRHGDQERLGQRGAPQGPHDAVGVWLGVWASDIVKYKLPSDPLTEIDIKRIYELKADPRYKDKMWHDELDTFLKIKKKSEQEAFSRYGLSYIVDTYLPES